MSSVARDIRHAFRSLTRTPWFSALAVATLTIGIGATTALFSLVDAVVLRGLPYREPDRLVEIWGFDNERSGMRVPGAIVDAVKRESRTIAAFTHHGPMAGVMSSPEGPVEVRGERVSANFHHVMGVAPLLGRPFTPDDERPGADPVMAISHRYWQQQFAGDPSVIGSAIHLDNLAYTIVGVMPPTFRTTFTEVPDVFWTPFVTQRTQRQECEVGFEMIGRLAPGVRIEDARRELAAIAARVAVDGWGSSQRRLGLVPLKEEVVRDRAYGLQLLLAAVAVMLLTTCANLAQLLLARSDGRLREFATRKAVGATGAHVTRLCLIESLLLAGAGGAGGVVLAWWLIPLLQQLAPAQIPRLADAAIDGRVLAAAVLISVATGCLFGLAPALRMRRLPTMAAMRASIGSRSPSRSRLRWALVLIQVAASVTLIGIAGLIGRTFLTLVPSDPGFELRDRQLFWISFDSSMPPARQREALDRIVERLEATPEVGGVAFASNVPFSTDERVLPVRAAAGPSEPGSPAAPILARADVRMVSPDFFDVMRMPLLQGRALANADTPAAPAVAVVNHTLARRLEPSGGVLGRFIRVGATPTSPIVQIVGVVADSRSVGTTTEILNEVYVPYAQRNFAFAFLVMESPIAPAALTAIVRREIRAVLPDHPMRAEQRVIELREFLRDAFAAPRFAATLASAFSGLTLLLAVVGLFGLVSYAASQRRQELGVRAALGAAPGQLVAMMLRGAMTMTAAGIAVGLTVAAYATRFLEKQLYGVDPRDPATLGGAALVMLVAAVIAAYVPARRAASRDPLAALRVD